jgi:HlyD family secretion protein
VVDVGAQIAGKIENFGKDPNGRMIDYGSPVEEGTVLAHIEDSLYAADVASALALVEQAKANVVRSQADLEQMRAKLNQADKNWKRAQDLGVAKGALSATDYDTYEATYLTAKATVGVGDASVIQAQKGVAQAEAVLKRAQTNLGYCTIKSPVKGVIVDRRVNIGQTVVASLNAPSLFLIAKDLKKMQVWASVNEADIGSIHPGQPVTFTVDAYPNVTFRGEVGKIRLNASMTQNVVTYTVEINTDNSSGKLLPYLTANVQFEVTRRTGVLMVPTAALRWIPATERVTPDARQEATSQPRRKPSTERGAAPARGPGERVSKHGRVWVQDGEFVRPIAVATGVSDGTNTEVQSDALEEGMEVVIGEVARSGPSETKNPFTPQLFGGGRRQQ